MNDNLEKIEQRMAIFGEMEDSMGIDTMVSDIADEVRADVAALFAEIRRLEDVVTKLTDDDTYLPDAPTDFEANRGLRVFARWYNQHHTDGKLYALASLAIDDPTTNSASVTTAYVVAQPVSREPIFDAEGFAWTYGWDGQDIDDRDDPDSWSWNRQRMETGGDAKYMTGPPLFMDWEDVLDYGPLRYAEEGEDTEVKVAYYPDGYKNGGVQGDPIVMDVDEFRSYMATRTS